MYWSRTGSATDFIAWLVLCGLWWAGGWLLSTYAFRLRSRERLFTGLAIGWLLFIVFTNLFARVISLSIAYWAASLSILTLGLLAAWRSKVVFRPRVLAQSLLVWQQALIFGFFLLLFVLINRGLAIFDDYFNLPVVSIIAMGDMPPHFHLNPDQLLDYHYSLHLFAASLVRVAGFFPWSAFDLSKAFSTALTLSLAWLWFRRFTNRKLFLFLGLLLVLFAGGVRWLLLLFPAPTVQEMGAGLNLLGSAEQSGQDLYVALSSAWNIEGGGPFPFPFAFTNGIFTPLSFAMGGGGAMLYVALLLLLLLARREWQLFPGIIYSLLFASLALIAEHFFVALWAGILIAGLIASWLNRSARYLLRWGWVLALSAALIPLMGGVITSILERWLLPLTGAPAAVNEFLPSIGGPRWPPAIVSSHLGALSLTSPWQLTLALLEMGPAFLLAPWVSWLAWKRIRSGRWFMPGLGFSALISFFTALFLQLISFERDLSRLIASALFIWTLLGFTFVCIALKTSRESKMLRIPSKNIMPILLGAGYLVTILGGIAMFPVQLIAASRPQLSYFVQGIDATLSQAYWDHLEEGAWIIDYHYPFRSAVLFGRTTGPAYKDVYLAMPEFTALRKRPDPILAAQAGYTYIYLDQETWEDLDPHQQQAFENACIKTVDEAKTKLGDFRRLLDVRACRNLPSNSTGSP